MWGANMKNIIKYKSGLICSAILALMIAAPLGNNAEATLLNSPRTLCFIASETGVRYCCSLQYIGDGSSGLIEENYAYNCGQITTRPVNTAPAPGDTDSGSGSGGGSNGGSSPSCTCHWPGGGSASFSGSCAIKPPSVPADATCTQH